MAGKRAPTLPEQAMEALEGPGAAGEVTTRAVEDREAAALQRVGAYRRIMTQQQSTSARAAMTTMLEARTRL